MNAVSLENDRYILAFTDDCTHYDRIMLLSNKNASTILAAFKNYQTWAERQSNHQIKELRIDRGIEYMKEMIK